MPRRPAILACLLLTACRPEPAASATTSTPEDDPAPAELAAASEPTPKPHPLEVIEPPPPEPTAFPGRETVTVDELLAALRELVDPLAAEPAVQADFASFCEQFELAEACEDPALYLDYVRVKIAFEATRDGGLWGLAWRITNREPRSDEIWAQWQALELPTVETLAELDALDALDEQLGAITAIAECDELSALFAFFARRLGLTRDSEVGLLWPTGNHVVAVWTLAARSEAPTRVVVPTTQIYLDPDASLGDDGFNPWRQRRIYDYRRADAAGELELPATLASYFVAQVARRGGRAQRELQADRGRREARQVAKLEARDDEG